MCVRESERAERKRGEGWAHLQGVLSSVHPVTDKDIVDVVDVPGASVGAAVRVKELEQVHELPVHVPEYFAGGWNLKHGRLLLQNLGKHRNRHKEEKAKRKATRGGDEGQNRGDR